MSKSNYELEQENKALLQQLTDFKKLAEEAPSVRAVGKIISGPDKEGNLERYRVEVGGQHTVINLMPALRGKPEYVFEKGDEVLIMENVIVKKIPKKLEERKIVQTYNLAHWDDIIGLDEQLADIQSALETTQAPTELYEAFGITPVKGILLYGPPGCGKTMIGKAIASTVLGANEVEKDQFTFLKGAEILDKFVGESENRIGRIFKQSREYTKRTGKRAVLFIDEAEAILDSRQSFTRNMASTIVPTFLAEMDGIEGDNPFVILSTNIPESLDPAIIRDGRIDLKIGITRPTKKGLADLLEFYFDGKRCLEPRSLADHASEMIWSSPLRDTVSGAMASNIANLTAKGALDRFLKDKSTQKGIILADVIECLTKMIGDNEPSNQEREPAPVEAE